MLKKLSLSIVGWLAIQPFACETKATLGGVYAAMSGASPLTMVPEEFHRATGSILTDDPFIAAGRADPQSAAVCSVIGLCKDNTSQEAGTGSLIEINRRLVVITTAQLHNPTHVEFFLADGSSAVHKVTNAVSKGTIDSENLKPSDVQVLFLDQTPTVTPLTLATKMPIDIVKVFCREGWLKTIGRGNYYTQLQGADGSVNPGFARQQTPVRINLKRHQDSIYNIFDVESRVRYNPSRLETHLAEGFVGAPVFNERGDVESLISGSTNPLKEKPSMTYLRYGANFGTLTAFGVWAAKHGKHFGVIDRFAFAVSVAVCLNNLRNAPTWVFNVVGYQPLSYAEQDWLRKVVSEIPSE